MIYVNDEEGATFRGIRVKASVTSDGKRKDFQKYFSFYNKGKRLSDTAIAKLKKEAEVVNKEFEDKVAAIKGKTAIDRKVSDAAIAALFCTGIHRVRREGVLYVYPVLRIGYPAKQISIGKSRSLKQAFGDAMKLYPYKVSGREVEKMWSALVLAFADFDEWIKTQNVKDLDKTHMNALKIAIRQSMV